MRHETRDRRQKTRDRRQETSTFSKVMVENILEKTAQLRKFFMTIIFFSKMRRGGAKIMWRGAADALLRWRENFI